MQEPEPNQAVNEPRDPPGGALQGAFEQVATGIDSERAQLSQLLRNRRDAIAENWYQAVQRTGSTSLDAAQVRLRLSDLAGQVVALLLTEPFDRNQAKSIGATLACLTGIQPEACGGMLETLACGLVQSAPANDIAAMQPRLAALLAGLATGFFKEAHKASIVERERADRALHESEAKYRRIFEDLTDEVALADLSGRVLMCSRQSAILLGYDSIEEVIGKNGFDLIAPEDRPWAKERARQVLETGIGGTREYSLLKKDGTCFPAEVSASVIMDADGNPQFIVGVGRDITDRIKATERIREAEARYQALVENIPAITYTTGLDEASRTLYISPQIETLLGFSPSDCLADPYFWETRIHPDDQERVGAEFAHSRATGEPFTSEYRVVTRDGRVLWFRDGAVLVRDADAQPLCIQGVMFDITERKQAEEALRHSEETARGLLNATADAAFLMDVTGIVLGLNEATAKVIGKSIDQVMGSPIYDFLDPEIAKARRDRVDEAVRSRKPIRFEDEREGRWIDNSVYPVLNAQGKVARIAVHGRDITVQRQIEELLMRRALEMGELYKTSLEINSKLEVPLLLQAIVQRATELLGVQVGALYLMRPDGQTLEVVIGHNLPKDRIGVILHLGEGLAGRVAQSGSPLIVEDYRNWEGRAAVFAHSPYGRMLGVPLKVQDKVIGIINVTDETAGSFREDQVRLLSLFAAQAAIAIENARLYQAERDQREMAETLREVGATLASTLEMPTVLERLLEQVGRVVPSDAASIMLLEDDHARVAHWRGEERFGVKDLAQSNYRIADSQYLKQMLVTGEPVVVPDTGADPNWVHVPGTEWLRSFAAAPIRVRDEVIGFLDVSSTTRGSFEQVHAERLLAFADQAAIALENARLYRAEREQRELAEALRDTAAALNSTLNFEEVLDRILANVGYVVPHDAVNVMLIEEESGVASVARSRGYVERGLGTFVESLRFQVLDVPGLRRMAETGHPLVVPDTRAAPDWIEIGGVSWPRSYIGVPIRLKGRTIGFLNLDSDQPGFFAPVHVERLRSFADQAATAIENARLYQAEREQRELAETLREVGSTLVSTLHADAVLDRLLEQVSRVVSNDAVDIRLFEGNHARPVRWRGYERFGNAELGRLVFPMGPVHDLQETVETDQAVLILDTHADPGWTHYVGFDWLRSYAGVPIRMRGEVIGFLDVVSATPGFFGPKHAERLKVFADQAAIALENARLYAEAQEAASHLQAMSHRLVEAQEVERRNIARELHDEIGQIVTGLKLRLEMSTRLPDIALRDNLREVQGLVQELLERVRELSLDLRPAMLDDLGLLPALLWLFERFTAQTDVPVAFKHAGVEQQRFAPEIETAAYRIVQEALTNVARHASASAVTVRLWATSETLGVQVEDDGVGFDPEVVLASGASTGLSSMRERAALLGSHLGIESSVGAGTCLTAELPLGNPA